MKFYLKGHQNYKNSNFSVNRNTELNKIELNLVKMKSKRNRNRNGYWPIFTVSGKKKFDF